MLPELYKYRRLIWKRGLMDFRHRYAGTGIGFAWNILHPLALIAIYWVIFGVFFKRSFDGLPVPYPVFLCAGLLPWLSFSECITRGTEAFRTNAPYLKRLPVPEQVFVAQTALSATFHLVTSFCLVIALAIAFGHSWNWHWILLPLPFILLQITGFGIGAALGTINVFFPDTAQVVNISLRFAFWAAPVLFPLSFFTDHGFGPVVMANPATVSLIAIRDLFIFGRIPDLVTWAGMLAWVVVTLLAGTLVLNGLRKEIRDVL